MDFSARVYFDFTCDGVWRLYQTLAAAARAGAGLSIEWRPFSLEEVDRSGDGAPVWETKATAGGLHALAAYEWVRVAAPERHGAFLQAVLSAIHAGGADAGDWNLHHDAALAAGVDGQALLAAVRDEGAGYAAVGASHREAVERGVFGTPTVVRWGPPLFVKMNAAAQYGDPVERLRTLDGVMEDDALWELKKP